MIILVCIGLGLLGFLAYKVATSKNPVLGMTPLEAVEAVEKQAEEAIKEEVKAVETAVVEEVKVIEQKVVDKAKAVGQTIKKPIQQALKNPTMKATPKKK